MSRLAKSPGVTPANEGLDEEAAAGLLRQIVAIPSPSGEERAVGEALVAAASSHAREAYLDAAGNFVARFGRGELKVLLLGHMDTAPGHVELRESGGRLYGRGAVDAKGPLCAALSAITRAPKAVLANLAITLVGAVEEEVASSRGARHALKTLTPPDMVVILEPSGWERYTLGYKGQLGLTLTAQEPVRHTATPDATATERVVSLHTELKAWVDKSNLGQQRLFEQLQLKLLAVNSESDGLNERCEARLSMRLPPAWPATAVREVVTAAALRGGVRAEFTGGLDAHASSSRSELARAFRVAIRANGGGATPTLKTGSSDMNVVAPHWRVPLIAYGPGDSSLDHTPHENVLLADYLRSIAVLGGVLAELAKTTG